MGTRTLASESGIVRGVIGVGLSKRGGGGESRTSVFGEEEGEIQDGGLDEAKLRPKECRSAGQRLLLPHARGKKPSVRLCSVDNATKGGKRKVRLEAGFGFFRLLPRPRVKEVRSVRVGYVCVCVCTGTGRKCSGDGETARQGLAEARSKAAAAQTAARDDAERLQNGRTAPPTHTEL